MNSKGVPPFFLTSMSTIRQMDEKLPSLIADAGGGFCALGSFDNIGFYYPV